MSAANPVTLPLAGYKAQHVRLAVDGKVATITLDRPDKKNPLTFESYAEIVDLFRAAAKEKAVKAFVVTGAGGNFCSGGDVFEIIEPLVCMPEAQRLDASLAAGPTSANAMTKRMPEMEWAMSVERAIEAEAVAQALCMETEDFARAYRAFAAKQKPVFEGN